MTTLDINVSPLGRVEGDLDVRVTIEDGVVTSAYTEAAMFRGFETILRGKDPQAGLIVTPRICGICGGSHLYKSAYALDVAWQTHLPPNATLIRSISQACETLQSIPRYFYAIFGIDLAHPNYSSSPLYEEAVRRFSVYTGTSYQKGVTLSNKPVEVYAIFGGQWPHSSFMVPGGVMCAPTLSDITRATAVIEHWGRTWLEGQWLGCTVERWLENETWQDVLDWVEEKPEHRESDCGFFIRYAQDIGLDTYGQGLGNYLSAGTYFDPESYMNPTIDSRQDSLIGRGGVYCDGEYHPYDQWRIVEDVTHAFYLDGDPLHPFDGRTDPVPDVMKAREAGKYTWAKAPRYDVPGVGLRPLEVGPLARRIAAGAPAGAPFADVDPLFLDAVRQVGPSVLVRQMARMHEAAKYYQWVRDWLRRIDLHESFYTKPEPRDGRGFGGTEAARGALSDWITLKDGKIENYQVITPSGWNLGPRDRHGQAGPIETALVGTPIRDQNDPIELGHVTRSFDACIVCTVHAYDGRGKELSTFVVNGMV
ncbi:MAG: nickel-dependent hydrogenase large subunit [Mobilicoccus sp.]|nr:nickel-dependent hydrogenase large subunit [Mobilicoccus sp.]